MQRDLSIFQKSVYITKPLLFSIIFRYMFYGTTVCINILFFMFLRIQINLKVTNINVS